MDTEAFKQQLQALRKELTEADYFALILDRLDKDPSTDERNILEISLGAYASVDPARVAKYWEPFLSSNDAF